MSSYNRDMGRSLSLRNGRGLPAFSLLTLGWMILVILEGAVVRATSSGGGCGNHWPLCNGDVLPHHPRLATIIEFTHRSMTGVCTMLTVAMITWVFLARPKLHPARLAAVWSGVLLVTEGALGAVLVKGGYVEGNTSDARVVVQCIHFTNTMLLVAAMTMTWWRVRRANELPLPEVSAVQLRSVSWIALASAMITGATGSVAALADTLFPSASLRQGLAADFDANSPLLIHMRWMHPAAALICAACVLWFAVKLRNRASRWLVWLVIAQLILGVLDILLLAPISLQVLHLLGADLFWIALVVASGDALQKAHSKVFAGAASTGHQGAY